MKEKIIAPKTRGDGSVWDIAFSRDPQQKYLYVADGQNMKVHILDRQSLEELTSFGDGGRQPGQFYAVHSDRHRLEGQPLHGRDLRGQTRAEVHLQGCAALCRATRACSGPSEGEAMMTPRREAHASPAALAVAIVALGVGSARSRRDAARTPSQAPRFEVDPLWPKPLPNHWVLGNVIGVGVDAQRSRVHRPSQRHVRRDAPRSARSQKPPLSECCVAGAAGARVRSRRQSRERVGRTGRKAYVWPTSNHGISIDNKDNVWIGGNGAASDRADSHILKFTHDGKFLAQIGVAGTAAEQQRHRRTSAASRRSRSTSPANEAFVADGYGNNRVAVLDMNTRRDQALLGRLRQRTVGHATTARTIPTRALIKQFRTRCTAPSRRTDGLVYVCDRPNDRIQVFRKNGKFVKEKQSSSRGRAATARCGTSRSRRIRSRSTSSSPTARTSAST